MPGVGAHGLAPHPAALTLLAEGALHADQEPRDFLALVLDERCSVRRSKRDLRDDEEGLEKILLGPQQRREILGRAQEHDAGLEVGPDATPLTRGLQRLR